MKEFTDAAEKYAEHIAMEEGMDVLGMRAQNAFLARNRVAWNKFLEDEVIPEMSARVMTESSDIIRRIQAGEFGKTEEIQKDQVAATIRQRDAMLEHFRPHLEITEEDAEIFEKDWATAKDFTLDPSEAKLTARVARKR